MLRTEMIAIDGETGQLLFPAWFLAMGKFF